MPGSILGTRVKRVEDPNLITGRGRYVGDVHPDGLTYLAFVRSHVAHGRIKSIDTSAAAAHPGVLCVLTAADVDVEPYHTFVPLNMRVRRPPLATDKVRFVGEAVAAVVASSPAAAADAAELVAVDLEPLPAAVDPEQALMPGASLQFEELGSNLAAGQKEDDAVDPLEGAEVVVRARLQNQRVAVVPMEGNAITVVPGEDGDGHDLTVYVSTQMPHMFGMMAARVLKLDGQKIRVITPDVGGSFGGKGGVPSEHAVAIVAARRLGRPVTWVETRTENLSSMHGRGQVQYVELGLDREGVIRGLRCRIIGDSGAYGGFGGALPVGPTRLMAQGTYRIPRIGFDVAVALTNTAPMGAFRGAGRPEAAEMLERMMDLAADELGIDPVEIRRRNLLQPEDLPLTTLTGAAYESGDYPKALEEAVRLAGYEELRAEQAARRDRGDRRLLGIGVSCYVEVTGGAGGQEYGSVEVHPDGGATIKVGTSAHGQGHATSFSMIVADLLGIPLERIRFVQSDTAEVPRGGGTGGSRSLQMGGNAVRGAAIEVFDRARELTAELLEANSEDIVALGEGMIGVVGAPSRALSWGDLSRAAQEKGSPLEASVDFKQSGATFPFGAHVAVVEVDLDTGQVRPLRHIAVDDCGRVLNPVVVEGQQHGGVAQGLAQALLEEMVYGPEGNPLSATLIDYGMPTAAEMPAVQTLNTETPTPLNPLGAKGIGESGTIGSTPAVHNAVIDALSHLGIRHIDMPCTPDRVWRAIQDAEKGTQPPLWRDPPPVFEQVPLRSAANRPQAADVDI